MERTSAQTTFASAPGEFDKRLFQLFLNIMSDPRMAAFGMGFGAATRKIPSMAQDARYTGVYNKATTQGLPLWRGFGKQAPADPGDFGIGPYYSTSRERASMYGPKLRRDNLRFENPLVMHVKDVYNLTDDFNTVRGKFADRFKASKDLGQTARLLGHDAIIAVKPKGSYSKDGLYTELEVVDLRPFGYNMKEK